MSSHQEAGLRESGKSPLGSKKNKVYSGPPPTPSFPPYTHTQRTGYPDQSCLFSSSQLLVTARRVSSSQHVDLHVPGTSYAPHYARSVSHASLHTPVVSLTCQTRDVSSFISPRSFTLTALSFPSFETSSHSFEASLLASWCVRIHVTRTSRRQARNKHHDTHIMLTQTTTIFALIALAARLALAAPPACLIAAVK